MRVLFTGLLLLFFSLQKAIAGTPEDVRRIMHNSQNWMPQDYSTNLNSIENIGAAAVPTLLKMLAEAEHQYSIGHICTALGRVPSAESIPHLEAYLQHSDWLVRSNCGESAAKIHSTIRSSDADLTTIFLVMTTDSNCSVRQNIAAQIGEMNSDLIKMWSLAQLQQSSLSPCDAAVALFALENYPVEEHVGTLIISVLENPQNPLKLRESAAYALHEYHYPPANDICRQILNKPNPGGNLFSACIVVLGEIGDSSDITLLNKMIDLDPYNGQGVWSVKSREAIQNINAGGR